MAAPFVAVLLGSLWLPHAVRAAGPVLRLEPDCRICPLGQRVSFSWGLFVPKDAAILVESSIVEIVDERGRKLSFEDYFCKRRGETLPAGSVIGSSCDGGLGDHLASLGLGEYTLTWKLGKISSNTVRVAIAPADTRVSPLIIEPVLPAGIESKEPEVIAYLINTGAESLELPGAWASASLIVDGIEYRRAGWRWSGTSGLGPGQSWGTVVGFNDFQSTDRKPVKAGRHQVQLVMAGQRSNTLALDIDRDTCTGRF